MNRKNVIKMKIFEGKWIHKDKVEREFNNWMMKQTGDFPKIDIIDTHVNLADGEYVVTVIYKQFLTDDNLEL